MYFSAAAKAEAPALRERANTDHMPSLDGLRAISILLVLLGHLGGTRGFAKVDLGIGDYSHFGVVVFFVISGFLITRLLLIEHAKKGTISLKRFYARRSLRLFPAAYAYITFIMMLGFVGFVQVDRSDLLHAATYTINYAPGHGHTWQLGHLWSLSIEEQFYLIWPCTVFFVGPRRAMWVALGVILIGPVARFGGWLFLRGTPYGSMTLFPMIADSLASGCVLACARNWLESQGWYLKLFKPSYSALVGLAVIAANRYMGFTVVSVFGTSVVNIGLAVLIHRSVYCSRDWTGRFLNWKPVAAIGVLSYSLYLWQQLFLNRHSGAWINAFPQNLALTIAAALSSYFLLEKPLLKLRHRLRA